MHLALIISIQLYFVEFVLLILTVTISQEIELIHLRKLKICSAIGLCFVAATGVANSPREDSMSVLLAL